MIRVGPQVTFPTETEPRVGIEIPLEGDSQGGHDEGTVWLKLDLESFDSLARMLHAMGEHLTAARNVARLEAEIERLGRELEHERARLPF